MDKDDCEDVDIIEEEYDNATIKPLLDEYYIEPGHSDKDIDLPDSLKLKEEHLKWLYDNHNMIKTPRKWTREDVALKRAYEFEKARRKWIRDNKDLPSNLQSPMPRPEDYKLNERK